MATKFKIGDRVQLNSDATVHPFVRAQAARRIGTIRAKSDTRDWAVAWMGSDGLCVAMSSAQLVRADR